MEEKLRIGSLCTGYGGLDIAVLAVFGGTLAWCADNDKHVSVILAGRYPDTPNLGDLTTLDWTEIPAVDVLCAGFPCQDISFSGRGAGIEKGVRSGIWRNIVTGIRIIRPTLIVVENVAAIRSRGLNRVLGDLAALGVAKRRKGGHQADLSDLVISLWALPPSDRPLLEQARPGRARSPGSSTKPLYASGKHSPAEVHRTR